MEWQSIDFHFTIHPSYKDKTEVTSGKKFIGVEFYSPPVPHALGK